MMFAGNPGVLAAGVGGKTYDEFVAHIEALATGGSAAWDVNGVRGTGSYVTTPTAISLADMWGSSWMATSRNNSSPARLVQHGLPSQAAFDFVQSGLFKVFFRLNGTGITTHTALNRNGFLSKSVTASTGNECLEVIYWDGERAQRMQPSLGLGPEPYDWT